MLNNPTKITQSDIARADRFWGSRIWRDVFYEEVGISRGGKPLEVKITKTTALVISELYQRRLREIFPCVSDVAVIRNTAGYPIYCLVHAGPKEVGKEIVNRILNKMGDPLLERGTNTKIPKALEGQMAMF